MNASFSWALKPGALRIRKSGINCPFSSPAPLAKVEVICLSLLLSNSSVFPETIMSPKNRNVNNIYISTVFKRLIHYGGG